VVIPVHDINPLRRTPWVTWALVAVNVVVFFLTPGNASSANGTTTLAQQCKQEQFFDRYAAIPRELTHDKQLPLAANGDVGQDAAGHTGCVETKPSYHKSPFLSAFTSMFLHGGWLHLLGNMLFLVIFGNNIEDKFGRLRFLMFYLAAGLVAAYGFALAQSNSTETLIGASGAISGVLGAYLVLWPRARVWSLVPFFFFIPLRLPAWVVLGLWFLLQWAYASGAAVSDAGNVAYAAHVVGFVFGAIVGLAIRAHDGPPPEPARAQWRRATG
jgi:membrane associated rhomboid family serine protease